MRYAMNVEHAAAMNTIRKLLAYESLAALCNPGGSLATNVAECLISVISCERQARRIRTRLPELRDEKKYAYPFGPWAHDPLVQLGVQAGLEDCG